MKYVAMAVAVLSVWACNGCFIRETKPAAPIDVSATSLTIAKRLIPYLDREDSTKYRDKVSEILLSPDEPSIARIIDSSVVKGGFEGLRYAAFQRGYFIPTYLGLEMGVYKIAKKDGAVIEVEYDATTVFGDKPKGGFIALTRLGDEQLLVLPAYEFGRPSRYDLSKLQEYEDENFNRVEWPEGLFNLTGEASSPLPQTKEFQDCGISTPASFREALHKTFAGRLEAFTRLIRAGGKSTPEISRAFGATFATSECPWMVLHLLGRGFSPLTQFNETPEIAAVRFAFLGSVALACGNEREIKLEPFPKCAWRHLLSLSAQDLRRLLSSLGEDPLQWQAVLAVYSTYIDYVKEYQPVVKHAFSFGFQTVPWFDKLASKMDVPRVARYQISKYNSRQGNWSPPAVETFDFTTHDIPLPVVSAIYSEQHPGVIDNCAVPVLWEDDWWRVCPVPKKPD